MMRSRLGGALVLILSLSIAALAGCAGSSIKAQIAAINSMGYIASTVADQVRNAEREEGLEAILSADSRSAAQSALEGVKSRYRPFWAAYDMFVMIRAEWGRDLVEGSGTIKPESVLGAFCKLEHATEGLVKIPSEMVTICRQAGTALEH